jgi:hypothetical protein
MNREILVIIIILLSVVLFIIKQNRYEGYSYSSGPLQPLNTDPAIYPTQGLVRPVFGYVYGHGKQMPGYGPEGILTVHPSKYNILNEYKKDSRIVYNLDEKIRRGQPMTIPESFKYANANHQLNKLQGYFSPYFY